MCSLGVGYVGASAQNQAIVKEDQSPPTAYHVPSELVGGDQLFILQFADVTLIFEEANRTSPGDSLGAKEGASRQGV